MRNRLPLFLPLPEYFFIYSLYAIRLPLHLRHELSSNLGHRYLQSTDDDDGFPRAR
jgi:hypothetical protein